MPTETKKEQSQQTTTRRLRIFERIGLWFKKMAMGLNSIIKGLFAGLKGAWETIRTPTPKYVDEPIETKKPVSKQEVTPQYTQEKVLGAFISQEMARNDKDQQHSSQPTTLPPQPSAESPTTEQFVAETPADEMIAFGNFDFDDMPIIDVMETEIGTPQAETLKEPEQPKEITLEDIVNDLKSQVENVENVYMTENGFAVATTNPPLNDIFILVFDGVQNAVFDKVLYIEGPGIDATKQSFEELEQIAMRMSPSDLQKTAEQIIEFAATNEKFKVFTENLKERREDIMATAALERDIIKVSNVDELGEHLYEISGMEIHINMENSTIEIPIDLNSELVSLNEELSSEIKGGNIIGSQYSLVIDPHSESTHIAAEVISLQTFQTDIQHFEIAAAALPEVYRDVYETAIANKDVMPDVIEFQVQTENAVPSFDTEDEWGHGNEDRENDRAKDHRASAIKDPDEVMAEKEANRERDKAAKKKFSKARDDDDDDKMSRRPNHRQSYDRG